MAQHLVGCFGDVGLPSYVRIVRLLHTNVSLDIVRTTGVSDDFEPILVDPSQDVVAGGRGRGRSRGRGTGSRGKGRAADPAQGPVDFMPLLDGEPRPRRSRPDVPQEDTATREPSVAGPTAKEMASMVAAALGMPEDEVPDAQLFVAGFGDLDAELLVPDDFAEEVDVVMDALATAAQPDTVPLGEGSDEEEAEGAPGGAAEDEAEAGRERPPVEAAEEVAVANEVACVERQPGVFVNSAGKVIGQLHRVGAGRKATCRIHAHCVCWVSRQCDPPALEASLRAWLAEVATQKPATAAVHAVSAYHLKMEYGMKPRKPPGVA